jgi:hypothetical protein
MRVVAHLTISGQLGLIVDRPPYFLKRRLFSPGGAQRLFTA